MPNRIIKESTFTSDKIASLSDFEFRLWIGLITQADDAGRGDARPAIIKGRVFALRERVTIKDIDNALHVLAAHNCVDLYTVGGKPYYEFPNWAAHQRVRDVKPKYPGKEEADESFDNSPQSSAIRRNPPPESNPIQSESESESNTNPFASEAMQSAFSDWLRYKQERREGYKPTGEKSLVTRLKNDIDEHGEQTVIDAIRYSMSQGWKGIYYPEIKKKTEKRPASYDIEKAMRESMTTVPKVKKRQK